MKFIKKSTVVGMLFSSVLLLASCGGGGGGGSSVSTAAPSGSGSFTLDPVTKVISGSITTSNVTGANAAHIHDGDVGVAGPVVVGLVQSSPGTWSVPANTAPLTDAQIARLNVGGYYVNVHTTLNPAGEIRGQLTQDSSTANKFNATLDLAHEVPAPITPVSSVGTGVMGGY